MNKYKHKGAGYMKENFSGEIKIFGDTCEGVHSIFIKKEHFHIYY